MATQKLAYDFGKQITRNGGNWNWNSHFFGTQSQPENHMGIWIPSPNTGREFGSLQKNSDQASSSSTILSRIGSPVSALYVTEKYMGFPQFDLPSGIGNSDFQTPPYQSPGDRFSFEKPVESSGLKSHFCSNQNYGSDREKSGQVQGNDFSEREKILQLKRKLLDDFDTSDRNQDISASPFIIKL